ncbi:hypothetical protein HGH93_08510 [Chitinophaga polysaccharea]|uniref:DUF6138 family protein n=1 Tax=Chitinophaga polysaccharea TaxID=1293035 RepID=UPI001454F696|nr:DUF6138 family protein [Chitinophaga polysaccharea]NLR58137.1 hypothetical protein [Chitinophaga polysaccharea]
MTNELETIAKDIAHGVFVLLEQLNKKKDAAAIIKQSRLQVGIFDFARFVYKNGEMYLYTSDDDFSDADMHYEGIDTTGVLTDPEAVIQLEPLLHAALQPVIAQYIELPILDYRFRVYGQVFVNGKRIAIAPYSYTSESRRKQLLSAIAQYIDQRIDNGQYPTKELDTFFLSRHLLDEGLFHPLEAPRIIAIFDKIGQLNKANKDTLAQHRHHIIYALQQWAEEVFIPRFYTVTKATFQPTVYTLQPDCRVVGPGLLDLLVYTAVMIIKYAPNYSQATGIRLAELAGELGSSTATTLLQSGTGKFKPVTTNSVELQCNDILSTVSIWVRQENEDAYQQALEYLIGLLEQDFPRSYAIELKSKVKSFLPIKNTGKKGTLRFFANALTYKALFPLLEKYARIAMSQPYEWYTDAEAEMCCLPGTYAVLGLGLASTDYFQLVQDYMKQVDTEHQSVQNHFTLALISQYGVNADTIPTIFRCLLACQDMKPIRELQVFEQPVYASLLLELVRELPGHEIEHIIGLIWGGTQKLVAIARKKGANPALEGVLAAAAK